MWCKGAIIFREQSKASQAIKIIPLLINIHDPKVRPRKWLLSEHVRLHGFSPELKPPTRGRSIYKFCSKIPKNDLLKKFTSTNLYIQNSNPVQGTLFSDTRATFWNITFLKLIQYL